MKDIPFDDRDKQIEELRSALSLVGFQFSYTHVDLILKVQKEMAIKGSKFCLSDASDILSIWKKQWKEYFDKKERESSFALSITNVLKKVICTEQTVINMLVRYRSKYGDVNINSVEKDKFIKLYMGGPVSWDKFVKYLNIVNQTL